VGPELFHAGGQAGGRRQKDTQADGRTDGRTDMTKLIVAFRTLANTPNNSQFTLYRYNESSTAANFCYAFTATDHAYQTFSNSLSRIFRELWGILVRFPAQVRDSLLENVPTGYGAHTRPHSAGICGFFQGSKADGEWNLLLASI
jgi:hypothetical protein